MRTARRTARAGARTWNRYKTTQNAAHRLKTARSRKIYKSARRADIRSVRAMARRSRVRMGVR